MKQQRVLDRINELLALMRLQVQGWNAMALTDMNRILEHVLVPVFREVYGYRSLENLNTTEQQNFPGIDLGDRDARVAFQITSTRSSDKINNALEKFVAHRHFERFERLIVFIITEKQQSYSGVRFDEIVQGHFAFDKDKDIQDYHDLLFKIQSLPLESLENVCSLLEAQFGDGSPSRSEILTEMMRASKARCHDSWFTLGVDDELADDLASDSSIGSSPDLVRFTDDTRVALVTGEFGIGKSLLCERLLQSAIAKCAGDVTAPIPVMLEAGSIGGNLQREVAKAAEGIASPGRVGVTVVIDQGDEVSPNRLYDILRQARILTRTWPDSSIVVASRPVFHDPPEAIILDMPGLSEESSRTLISRISRVPVEEYEIERWPESVREAIRRPLFAVMAAMRLRRSRGSIPNSALTLLAETIDHVITRSRRELSEKEIDLLCKLAVQSTDNAGGAIGVTDFGSSVQVQSVLATGLVINRGGSLRFPLPILAQWFASEALSRRTVAIESLIEETDRLEYWRHALVLFVSRFEQELVAELLHTTVRRCPAIAGEIVRRSQTLYEVTSGTLPGWRKVGERVVSAMESWIAGIGDPLSRIIARVRDDGSLRTVGVVCLDSESGINVSEGRDWKANLIVAWGSSRNNLGRVVAYMREEDEEGYSLWREHVIWRTPHLNQTWEWKYTLKMLLEKMTEAVKERSFKLDTGPIFEEEVWATAHQYMGYNRPRSIPLPEVLEKYQKRLSHDPEYRPWRKIRSNRRYYNHERMLSEVQQRVAAGHDVLMDPWPGPDLKLARDNAWDNYSHDRIIERVRTIFENALSAYTQLVLTYFPHFATRLRTYASMPVRLTVTINRNTFFGTKGTVSYHYDVLPAHQQNVVEIRVNEGRRKSYEQLLRWHEVRRREFDRIRRMRPTMLTWMRSILSYNAVFDTWAFDPVTELVYTWLEDDLEVIGWTKKDIEDE